jgi:CRP/FNR family transcriptional regulator, cyclic AMP receptor protein
MIPVQTLGPGDPVGWSWLVPPHRWHFDCHVLDHAEALVLEAPWLLKECERDHELGYQLLRRLVGTLSSRLAATRLQLLDLHQ